jgi:PhnB protein
MAKAKHPVPEGLHTVTPHLTIDNAAKALDWYTQALGGEERGDRAVGPDGKIMHAEIRIGNSVLYLNDPMMGGKDAKAIGRSPISFWIYVEDCDALFKRALAAGGETNGPMGQMADQFWGDRCGTFTDPFGYQWTIATRKEDLTRAELEQRQAEFMKQSAAQPTHA